MCNPAPASRGDTGSALTKCSLQSPLRPRPCRSRGQEFPTRRLLAEDSAWTAVPLAVTFSQKSCPVSALPGSVSWLSPVRPSAGVLTCPVRCFSSALAALPPLPLQGTGSDSHPAMGTCAFGPSAGQADGGLGGALTLCLPSLEPATWMKTRRRCYWNGPKQKSSLSSRSWTMTSSRRRRSSVRN